MSKPETVSQDQLNLELKPSSLVIMEHLKANNTSIRRRHNILHQTQDCTPTSLSLNSSFAPYGAQSLSQASGVKSTTLSDESSDESPQLKARIFSITTTSFLVLAASLTILVCCLCITDKAALHVNAYSNNPQQKVHNVKLESAGGPHLTSSLQSHQQIKTQQASSRPTNAADLTFEEKRIRQSIDRFDSGEQIRPPLLRQPTTVAPLSRVQASVDKAFNLQEAASQDTFMSPEDRERIMRHHENHYEGRNPDQQQPGNYDRYDQGEQAAAPIRQSVNSNQNLRPEASSPGAKGGDDESDYDDDGPLEGDKKVANLVPENRRRMAGSGDSGVYNQQSRFNNPQYAATNLDEGSNDDYGANDDAYFSRKSQNPSQLNSASSYNQNIRGSNDVQTGPSFRGNEGGQQESQGFGPGPNEAYMVDKAESGEGAGVDQGDDESGQYQPGLGDGSESTNIGDYETKMPDRRMMNSKPRGESAPYDSSIRGADNPNDASEADNDNDDASDGNEETGSAYAPSSLAGVKTQKLVGSKMNSRGPVLPNAMPRTSASAPIPLATPRPPVIGSAASLDPTTRPISPMAYQQPMQAPHVNHQQHYHHPIQVEREVMAPHPGLGQHKSVNAPYNPQNNPSHAGKYFIN